MDSATEIAVFSKEVAVTVHHHHIIRQSEDKTKHKILRRVIKRSIVHHNVHVVTWVHNTDGSMSVKTVNLIVRLASEKIYLNGIISHCLCGCIEAEAYKKNLKK